MKLRGPQTSLVAFLDVIACGFGAVVLLVLILPVGENPSRSNIRGLERIEELKSEISRQLEAERAGRLEIASLQGMIAAARSMRDNFELSQELPQEISSLENDLKAAESLLSRQRDLLKRKLMDVGVQERGLPNHLYGIPVDSDYLAFVVDTSGSMRKVWPKVIRTIKDVLVNYPQLRGFQVLSDQGEFLLGATGDWLSPETSSISRVVNRLRDWNAYSNSSPVEGVEIAVQTLYKPGISLGIFVVGDDYTGTNFDGFLGKIDSITAEVGQAGQLRIHALGFFNDQYSQHPERFTRLMQVLTFNHGGAFLYIGDDRPSAIEISRNRRIPVAD